MNINGVAKPNAFETSGFPNASRQHRNDQNKKKRWGCSKIGTEHKMWNLFGKPEVSKALGFAAHSVMRAQIMFRATSYNGRVSMNPLYPTYKTLSPPPYEGGSTERIAKAIVFSLVPLSMTHFSL